LPRIYNRLEVVRDFRLVNNGGESISTARGRRGPGDFAIRFPVKLDVLVAEFRGRLLDIMLLCETWHDTDSVLIRRLCDEG
jgi:hypothetical protein